MKRISYCFFIFVLASSIIYSQKLTILKVQKIIDKAQGEYYFPKLSPDATKLFFTSANCTGLNYYDFQSQKIVSVTNAAGAGYEYTFSRDGKSVFFRSNAFNDRGLRVSQSIVEKVIGSGAEQVLETREDLSTPKVMMNNNIAYAANYKISVKETAEGTTLKKSASTDLMAEPFVCIEHQKIALYTNGSKKILSPLGEGNYIWPSVSPDGSKLLFTFAGHGTYISDLSGNILVKLGYANAPKWSVDGKWVVYMVDKDNGERVTSSDIFASSSDGTAKFQLTNTQDVHEMYPDWSTDPQKVTFHSEDGSIYLIELKAE